MKKVVTLMLILGMASVASAGLQISVDGVQEPVDSEIFLRPSETVELDIWLDAPINPFEGVTWALVASTADATISGGVAIDGILTNNTVNGLTSAAPTVIPPAGAEGVWGSAFNISTSPGGAVGDVIVDSIIFHCEWQPNDVIIGLFAVTEDVEMDWAEALDTVTIHQIPEPATICLLGLGGLALLRRRK